MALQLVQTGIRGAGSALDKSLKILTVLLKNTGNTNDQKVCTSFRVPPPNYGVVKVRIATQPFVLTTREYSKKASYERDYESDSDSDSDNEGYKKDIKHKKFQKQLSHQERGDSQFWRRKMRTLHNLLDVNNDSVISFDDFTLLAKKFADLGHLDPQAYEDFINVMKETWDTQWGEITPYNLITAEQFLTDMHHAVNDKDLINKIDGFLPFIFKAVDKDHSGHLDLEEFKLFFKCLGLKDEDAAVSFAVIDENGDGKLSLKEFVKLGRDFFLTEDERRVSRMFWGPLVNK